MNYCVEFAVKLSVKCKYHTYMQTDANDITRSFKIKYVERLKIHITLVCLQDESKASRVI